MTNHEMVIECLRIAGTAFGSVFAVLALFYILVSILVKISRKDADAENA